MVVHRLSLVPQEQLQEEDKQQGKGVVKTTRQSMSLHRSGGGDAPDRPWARWYELVPPSWRSPRAARAACWFMTPGVLDLNLDLSVPQLEGSAGRGYWPV